MMFFICLLKGGKCQNYISRISARWAYFKFTGGGGGGVAYPWLDIIIFLFLFYLINFLDSQSKGERC